MAQKSGFQVKEISLTQSWTIKNVFSSEKTKWIAGPIIRLAEDCRLQMKLHKTADSEGFKFYIENIGNVGVKLSEVSVEYPFEVLHHLVTEPLIKAGEKYLVGSEFGKTFWTMFATEGDGDIATYHFNFKAKLDKPSLTQSLTPEQNPLSISTDLSKVLNEEFKNPSFPDWTLSCEGKKFPCHRFLLSARCQTFKTIFQSTDQNGSDDETTEIANVDLATLQHLLKYIYTDVVDDTNCDVAKLFSAADDFGIPGKCEKFAHSL